MTKQKKELPLWMQLQVVSSYSRGWALLLCLCGFFTIGGLHRFYVRRWISGILYLLTGGVFMVGTLYDLIQILRGEFDDDCGLHLESALRKRWDDRHAVWRYIGSTPGVGRYYINRDTIDHSVPNQVTCSFLVKINSLGAAAMKSCSCSPVLSTNCSLHLPKVALDFCPPDGRKIGALSVSRHQSSGH